MNEFFEAWGSTLREVGLGGFAVYALMNVWKRMITMADKHRLDNHEKDHAHKQEIVQMADRHRKEMADLERKHVEELASINREHRTNVTELVLRNMDEHRERNRIMVLGWKATAEAFAENGLRAPNPYPDVDEVGKEDPRKKSG